MLLALICATLLSPFGAYATSAADASWEYQRGEQECIVDAAETSDEFAALQTKAEPQMRDTQKRKTLDSQAGRSNEEKSKAGLSKKTSGSDIKKGKDKENVEMIALPEAVKHSDFLKQVLEEAKLQAKKTHQKAAGVHEK
mmetsp:Transcript_50335/g.79748  ORF Transcript_50335/g.79748 Transcript_50335/m.79748 type:complete len:140 (+) Transcript_50335:76-495(+)